MAEVAGRGVAERTGRVSATLPSWASHMAYKPAPPPLLLVQAFVNTIGMGADMLAHAEQAHDWLTDAGLIDAAFSAGPASPAFAADLRLVREARAGIQALITGTSDGCQLTQDELRTLDKVGQHAQARLQVAPAGRVGLQVASPAGRVAGGLLGLLLIIRDAQADGSWDRLKNRNLRARRASSADIGEELPPG